MNETLNVATQTKDTATAAYNKVLVSICFILALIYGFKAIASAMDGNTFTSACASAQRIWDGGSPYTGPGARLAVLPWVGMALTPFGWMPNLLSGALWFILNLVLLGCVLEWTLRVAADEGARISHALWVLPLVLSARVLEQVASHGSLELVVLALIVASLLRLKKDPWVAGVAAGVAGAINVAFLPFVILFAVQRRMRAVSGWLIAVLICVFVLPSIFIGPTRAIGLASEWYRVHLSPEAKADLTHPQGQTVGEFITHLTTWSNAGPDPDRPPLYVNVVDWPRPLARAITLAVGLALIFLTARGAGDLDGRRSPLSSHALFVAAAVLISPIWSPGQEMGLLFVYMALLAILPRVSGHMAGWGYGLLAAAVVLDWITVPGLVGDRLASFFGALSMGMWGHVILWLTVLWTAGSVKCEE